VLIGEVAAVAPGPRGAGQVWVKTVIAEATNSIERKRHVEECILTTFED
jgi:hypothetical protein